MAQSKIDKLLARQRALKSAINQEKRLSRQRKQKALYNAAKRLGVLDLTDDQVEAALTAYHTTHSSKSHEGGAQP